MVSSWECTTRTKDLNNDLGEVFRGWDPQFEARAVWHEP